MQEELQEARVRDEIPDTLLLLEHPPVLTLGKRTQPGNIRLSPEELSALAVEVFPVNRGGDVTYHGPGQLVGYPILDLKQHGRDINLFTEGLSTVFIRLLAQEYGIVAHSESSRHTGVFVGSDKITAFGISVRHWVTMHGFAFNVNTDLSHFDWIVPCGLTDRGVTSLERLTGVKQDMNQVMDGVEAQFREIFGKGGAGR